MVCAHTMVCSYGLFGLVFQSSDRIINIVTKARDENLKIPEKLFEENKKRPLFKTQEKDFQIRQYQLPRARNDLWLFK